MVVGSCILSTTKERLVKVNFREIAAAEVVGTMRHAEMIGTAQRLSIPTIIRQVRLAHAAGITTTVVHGIGVVAREELRNALRHRKATAIGTATMTHLLALEGRVGANERAMTLRIGRILTHRVATIRPRRVVGLMVVTVAIGATSVTTTLVVTVSAMHLLVIGAAATSTTLLLMLLGVVGRVLMSRRAAVLGVATVGSWLGVRVGSAITVAAPTSIT